MSCLTWKLIYQQLTLALDQPERHGEHSVKQPSLRAAGSVAKSAMAEKVSTSRRYATKKIVAAE